MVGVTWIGLWAWARVSACAFLLSFWNCCWYLGSQSDISDSTLSNFVNKLFCQAVTIATSKLYEIVFSSYRCVISIHLFIKVKFIIHRLLNTFSKYFCTRSLAWSQSMIDPHLSFSLFFSSWNQTWLQLNCFMSNYNTWKWFAHSPSWLLEPRELGLLVSRAAPACNFFVLTLIWMCRQCHLSLSFHVHFLFSSK